MYMLVILCNKKKIGDNGPFEAMSNAIPFNGCKTNYLRNECKATNGKAVNECEVKEKPKSLESPRMSIVLYRYLIVTPFRFSLTEVITWPFSRIRMMSAPSGVTRWLCFVVVA